MRHSVIAYHGRDVTTRDSLVSGRLLNLEHSNNRYDWLGPGAYFFENDPERADLFARASHDNPAKRYTALPIATPSVVGAVLDIDRWLDMTTQAGIHQFQLAFQGMAEVLQKNNAPIPRNRPASEDDSETIYRALDNAVFKWLHQIRATNVPPLAAFQAVRAAFLQGQNLAPTSAFHSTTHIQIALRDNNCVVGWFLPRGAALLTEQQYQAAKERLDAAVLANRKPRIRPSPSPR